MNAYTTRPEQLEFDPSGWFKLSSGLEMTKIPVIERDSLLFARLGHGVADEALTRTGHRLPTLAEYEEMHLKAHHIEPVTLPTQDMIVAAGIERTGAAIQKFRTTNMMSYVWCVTHDNAAWGLLKDWDRSKPVDNCGKHWAVGGYIVGWWTRHARRFGVNNDRMIQTPSRFHASEPTYVDYATTFHAVREPSSGCS